MNGLKITYRLEMLQHDYCDAKKNPTLSPPLVSYIV